jgi:hypothetical protein
MPKLGPMGRDMTMVSLNTADRRRTLERLRDRLAEPRLPELVGTRIGKCVV